MNCPVCGKEMEKGICHIYGGRGGKLAWVPYEMQKQNTYTILTKSRIEKCGGVVTAIHSTVFDNEEQVSWCCKGCGKIVIDVK